MDTLEQVKLALAPRLDIERQIGQGGMATVYLARELKHGRHVALKLLLPELGVVLGKDRFLKEIQLTATAIGSPTARASRGSRKSTFRRSPGQAQKSKSRARVERIRYGAATVASCSTAMATA